MISSRQRAAGLIAVFALALFALRLTSRPPPVHLDTARDWLFARACVEEGRCELQGVGTSVRGLRQGASWHHALVTALDEGLSIEGLTWLVDVVQSLAVAVGWLTALLLFEAQLPAALYALATAVLFRIAAEFPVLWNVSPMPLPWALATASLAMLAKTAQTRWAIALGAAVAAAADLHVAATPAAVLGLGAAICLARRPGLAALGLAAAFGVTVWVSSPEALRACLPWLQAHAAAAALFFALTLGAAAALRPTARSASPAQRGGVAIVAAWGALGVAYIVGGAATGVPLGPRYLLPAVPAAALALAWAGRRARWAFGITVVVLLAALAGMGLGRSPWNITEAAALAQEAGAMGYGSRTLFESLRVDSRELLGSVLAFGPPLSKPEPTVAMDLEVQRSPAGLALHQVPRRVDLSAARRCLQLGAEWSCQDAPLDAARLLRTYGESVASFAYPAFDRVDRSGPQPEAATVRWHLPLPGGQAAFAAGPGWRVLTVQPEELVLESSAPVPRDAWGDLPLWHLRAEGTP
jgi:hypothetical protein